MPMKSLETKLPAAIFQRVHRSYIVNLQQVDEVEESTVVVGKKALPLSKSLREEFMLRIGWLETGPPILATRLILT